MNILDYLTNANLICFLAGSLCGVIASIIIVAYCGRKDRQHDQRIAQHIRQTSYQQGWQAGKDSAISNM